MNPHLVQAVAHTRQQDVLRGTEQRRLVRELPGRPSVMARFAAAIASLNFIRRRSAEPRRTAPAAIDA